MLKGLITSRILCGFTCSTICEREFGIVAQYETGSAIGSTLMKSACSPSLSHSYAERWLVGGGRVRMSFLLIRCSSPASAVTKVVNCGPELTSTDEYSRSMPSRLPDWTSVTICWTWVARSVSLTMMSLTTEAVSVPLATIVGMMSVPCG